MRKLLLALLLCLVTVTGYCQSSSNPPLNIREEDGAPSAYPYMVKFSNGSVTDNGDGTVSINIPGLGGSTAWDDIGDPDADTSIALGGYETVFTSTLDEANHIVMKIDNTDADLANDTFLEVLEFTDNGDANGIFFDCRDNNGESKFKIGVEGNVTASGATFTIEKLATNHIGETTGAHGVVFDNDLSRAGKLSIDHIAEATGAHTIVFDNSVTLGVALGAIDAGGATSLEIPNTAGDVTVDAAGEIAIDSTQKQLAVYDGTEIAIPLRHMFYGPLNLTSLYTVSSNFLIIELDSTIFPDGIVITGWEIECSSADPTTELDANLRYCDDNTTGAFPGANEVLVDVLNTTTGNSSESNMAASDLGSGVVPTGKILYIDMDADPTDTSIFWSVKIEYYIPES